MTREERLKAASKCAAKYVHEEDKRIARNAFMDGCEFEGRGEAVKGEVLESDYSGEQVLDAVIVNDTDGAGLFPTGYLDMEFVSDSINPNIFKDGDSVRVIIIKQ